MGRLNPFIIIRRIRTASLRRRLNDENVTIISNNCTAGIVYNTLGLKFLSPTINLQINDEDFPVFLQYLDDFLQSNLNELQTNLDYPVGVLSFKNKNVRVDFLHYDSFAEAKQKWDQRKKRINKSNICVIWMINNLLSNKKINEFKRIEIKKKMLITYEEISDPNSIKLDIFNKLNYKNGEVFWYKHWFSVKRNIELIDFVTFLNTGECKYEK